MEKYICPCGYEYDPAVGDPDNGVAPGTAWENVPEDWACPVCGLDKDAFCIGPQLLGADLRGAAGGRAAPVSAVALAPVGGAHIPHLLPEFQGKDVQRSFVGKSQLVRQFQNLFHPAPLPGEMP